MAKKKAKRTSRKTPKKVSKDPGLLSPSEQQKVGMAIVLLVVFLGSFSLATGALQVGQVIGHGYHLSAFDINGQRRFRLLVSSTSKPDLAFFTHDGRRWNR